MKIMHMISGGDVGGAKTHVLSLVQGLMATDSVRLVCFTEGEFAADARKMGIPTTVLQDNNLLRVRRSILEMIRADGCEVLHCHGSRANLMGMLLRGKTDIPMISTVHSDYKLDYMGRPLANLTYGTLNRRALPRFDAWIGVSANMTQLLIARGFDPQRVFTLYNGVAFPGAEPRQTRQEYLARLGIEPDCLICGIAARINPVKDMTTLVRAFAKAHAQCPQMRLLIAGDGEQADEIRALAGALCDRDSYRFLGWEKDIDSFYNALDINLLTSVSEGFPYALPEGARMHCATIASEVGGVPDLIEDGVTGLLFTPGDVEALSAHMVDLAQDAGKRRRLSDALYEKTKRDFSLEAMLRNQRSIYETLLRRAARPKRARDGVVVCGAYGKGNSGDNAILNAIVEQLHRIDPDLPICALSRKPDETRLCAKVDAVYTFNILRIARRLRRSKLYLSGGGTLMQDATSTRSLLYYLFSIRQAKRAGCRVMLYGCGIGPIDRPRNRRRTARTLERCADVISVRDRYSLETLKALGVTGPETHLNADPALLIDPPSSNELNNYLRHCGLTRDGRYLLLAVRPWPDFEEKLDVFAAAAEYAAREYGLTPVLYAMEPQRDAAACRQVAERLSVPHLCLNAGTDGAEVLALIRRMALVISMRLHTLIFAAGQGVPMIGIVYDPKVSGFLDYLGQERYVSLSELEAGALRRMIDEALAENGRYAERIRQLRELAGENEALARRLLK